MSERPLRFRAFASPFFASLFLVSLLAVGAAACAPGEPGAEDAAAGAEGEEPAGHVVRVTARDFAFEAPAEVPSGWITLRMENAGEQEHFLVLWRLPEGRTFDDYRREVLPAFDSLHARYRAGELVRGAFMEALGAALPEWLGAVEGAGGPGLVAPGGMAETTVNLEPGLYVMECYVKTPEGEFHGALGMIRPLIVTEETTGAVPPEEVDLELTLSNYEIAVEGEPTAGERTVRVRFADDPEGLLSHDVHLARLEEGTELDEVVAWMDWVDALHAPAPAAFLGGAEQMPAGATAYLTVRLESGRYVWLSEEYGPRGVVREFRVP